MFNYSLFKLALIVSVDLNIFQRRCYVLVGAAGLPRQHVPGTGIPCGAAHGAEHPPAVLTPLERGVATECWAAVCIPGTPRARVPTVSRSHRSRPGQHPLHHLCADSTTAAHRPHRCP